MINTNITTQYSSKRILAYRRSLTAVFIIIGLMSAVVPCPAQNIVPLADLVPLQDLDVRTTDLIRLAESYCDALRDMKIAQMNLDTLTSLRGTAVVSQLEVRIANVNVSAAQRKVTILRAIAEKELAAAQAKLDILEQMEKVGGNGDKTTSEAPASQNRVRISQARATTNILQMILDMK